MGEHPLLCNTKPSDLFLTLKTTQFPEYIIDARDLQPVESAQTARGVSVESWKSLDCGKNAK
jgi:hypothetical protein